MATPYPTGAMEQPLAPTDLQEVTINKVSNGFVIRIGCRILVAKTWQEVSQGLSLYWKNPEAARNRYFPEDKMKGALKHGIYRNRPRKARRNR